MQQLGSTQNTTYKKLTYAPSWSLIEKINSRTITLSKRGKDFFKGKLEFPIKIRRNPETKEWEPAPNTKYIGCNDL